MKKKEGFLIVFFLVLLVVILGVVIYYFNKNKLEETNEIVQEYVPAEEVSDEQLRSTIISLYFVNKDSGEINPEARTININLLLENPYKYLLEQLIEGPKNEKLQKVIPDNTKINNVELKGDILYIDFSHEFIDNALEGKENESKIIETIVPEISCESSRDLQIFKIIETIVKTVTELNEVNAIKILIDGEENKCFKDEEINFEKEFLREDY